MKERQFYVELQRGCQVAGIWCYKLPDILGTRFTPDKPYDIEIKGWNGVAVQVEVKVIRGQSVPGNILRESQEKNFAELTQMGHRCYLLLWWNGSMWALSYSRWKQLREGCRKCKAMLDVKPLTRFKIHQRVGKKKKLVGGLWAIDPTSLVGYLNINPKHLQKSVRTLQEDSSAWSPELEKPLPPSPTVSKKPRRAKSA